MHTNSFIVLPGVQQTTEQHIWHQGIHTWDQWLAQGEVEGFSWRRKRRHDLFLQQAHKACQENDAQWLAYYWPQQETWRLWNLLKDDALYLDIETDGGRCITMIGLQFRGEYVYQLWGQNMDKQLFLSMLERSSMLVTFNGSSFDWPVLMRYFGIKKLERPHLDLRHVCGKIGLHGGLKAIEEQLGMLRDLDMDGSDAITLYHNYRMKGKQEYLDILVKYNQYDTENLRPLAEHAVPQLWKLTNQTHLQTG